MYEFGEIANLNPSGWSTADQEYRFQLAVNALSACIARGSQPEDHGDAGTTA